MFGTAATKPYKETHFATFPAVLIEPCILAGVPWGGVVLDPFLGSGNNGGSSEGSGPTLPRYLVEPRLCKPCRKRIQAIQLPLDV